ncbi:hypothetical protein P7C71_g2448, partial [Lecanoromycetidae sp. Uapishka_2]
MLGASSYSSPWPVSKRTLSRSYQTQIQQFLFANTAQRDQTLAVFQKATEIDWTVYTTDSVMFPKPIIFACGADYLVPQTGSDGVVRGYDSFTNTFEPMDDELTACLTVGPYKTLTMFALQRATTSVNAGEGTPFGRTVMRLCASALQDEVDDTQLAVDLLDPRKLATPVINSIAKNYRSFVNRGWTIDYFRGPDFYVLNMVLGYSSGKQTFVPSWTGNLEQYDRYWDLCVTRKDANLLCQAYYGFAMLFWANNLFVNITGEGGLFRFYLGHGNEILISLQGCQSSRTKVNNESRFLRSQASKTRPGFVDYGHQVIIQGSKLRLAGIATISALETALHRASAPFILHTLRRTFEQAWMQIPGFLNDFYDDHRW